MERNEDIIDNNKILNSICYCKTGLPWKKDNVVMAYPCEHMFHEKCFNNIYKTTKSCTLCGTGIERKICLLDKDIHHQRFADLLSMSYYDEMSENTPVKFLDSIFDIATFFARIPFLNNKKDGKQLCEQIFSLNNLTLKVYGLDKIKLEKNKVYVCNHVSHLELFIIYYLLGTGFLASNIIDEIGLGKIRDIVPLLTFARGGKNKINIVDNMKQFVEEHGSICLFPEGLMKHPDTLIRFRTGAFHIGKPVYAITIRHNDIISDNYIEKFFYKLGGKRNINMEVHIIGPYYPPFNEIAIENIRRDMALHGNMVLSRVSNRDIVDKKN
jgi:hypothetical protein